MKKRIISFICALSLILTLVPAAAPTAAASSETDELMAALLRDNSVMDNNIALQSIRLSNEIYRGEEATTKLLRTLGFDVIDKDFNKCSEGDDHVGFTIAKKELVVNSETYYIYSVVVRGTDGSWAEWKSNFSVGLSNVHGGFLCAATEVHRRLQSYIDPSNREHNILWITGHSRGAAVANYIAGLYMGAPNNMYLNTSAIHAYTFACPNVVKNPNKNYNIYNFNFKEDIVPQIPLSSWEFGKHGKNYTTKLSTWVDGDYWSESDMKSILKLAKKAAPTAYDFELAFSFALDIYKDNFKKILASWQKEKYASAISSFLSCVAELEFKNQITSDFEIKYLVSILEELRANSDLYPKSIVKAHESESYLEWIEEAYPLGYDDSAAGDYAVSKTPTAVVRSGPRETREVVATLAHGTALKVEYALKNSAGKLWYKLGGDYAGYYIYSENVAPRSNLPASTLTVSAALQHNAMDKGTSNKLVGVIGSNYPLSTISASLDGKVYTSFTTSTTTLNIAETSINTALRFSSLKTGTHKIVITATDIFGESRYQSLTFTVSEPMTDMPTLSVSDYTGGKTVTLSGPSGAAIYYTTNGSTPTTQSLQYSSGINLTNSTTIKAIAVKNGIASKVLSQDITVSRLPMPVINSIPTPQGSQVVITCEAGTMIYYSTGGSYLSYYAPFVVENDTYISAYAERSGYVTSTVAETLVEVPVPEKPVIVMPGNGIRVAQGSAVTLRWNPIGNASSYTVEVRLDGETIDTLTVTEPNATFLLDRASDIDLRYTFTVQAHNLAGSGEVSEELTVDAMAPGKVSFVDWDGTVLSEQIVPYGSAAVAPQNPSRKGYYFRHWDREFTSVTSDLVVTPVYQIITYTVTFLDNEGEKLDTQQIPYSGAAAPPVDQVALPAGHVFLGWSITAEAADSLCDLTQIDSNMTARAVIGWEDSELPIYAQIESAQRNDDNANERYEIKVRLTNTPEQYTTALLRVSLKTAEGKMVKTESRTVSLSANGSEQYTFVLNYSGDATKAEVVVLGYDGDYLTGSAFAKAVSANVTVTSAYIYGDWSQWSNSAPAAQADRQIETRTLYRYKTKSTTSSSNPTMDGWTLYDQSSYWGEFGPWSEWSPSAVTPSDSVEVQTRTEYKYYRYYCSKNYNHGWYGGAPCSSAGYNCSGYCYTSNYLTTWTDVSYETAKKWVIATGDGQVRRGSMGTASYWYYYPNKYSTYHGTRTAYSYRTRPLYTTYYFYRWSDWSAWQENIVNASSTTQVETMTQYRYCDKNIPVQGNLVGNEDTRGEFYTFAGTVPVDASVNLTGKQATVMVYKGKNSDPNESQLQYVGQITIGEGNSYDISFKTKDVPSVASGDYVVCLSLQGSTGLINIGVIDAPAQTYTVNFYDDQGQEIDTQIVEEGKNAVIPEAPEKEGYRFIAWSDSGTNIHSDMAITAIYVPITYAVVFVDWVNGSAIPLACEYGTDLQELAATIVPTAEGHDFIGWDQILNGQTTVTENIVVSAVFEPKTYTVTFYDSDGEDKVAISTQTIAYGQSAILPEMPEYAGYRFLGWSTEEMWWNVTCDMDVYPIIEYSENTSIPTYSFEQDIENGVTWLILSAEDNATVYYTLDDTVPVIGENAIEYTGPVALTGGEVIRAIAAAVGKNHSEIIDAYVDYNEGNSYNGGSEIVEVGTYTPVVSHGDTVVVNVGITDNPGLLGYYFIIECDPSVYYIDCIGENGEYNCVAGSVASDGTMLVAPEPGVGWKVLWFNTSTADGDGVLFTLTLRVSDGVTLGTYPIKVSYSAENMLGEDYNKTSATVEGSVSTNVMLGDVNADGSLTLADVIAIARHIVGLDIISGINKLMAADVKNDGVITTADAVRLARFIAGLETTLSPSDDTQSED